MCWVGFHRLASQGLTHSPIYRHGPAKAMKSDEKLLKNHCVQWLLDYTTIEKPLAPMVAGPKTIDTNGCFPTIHSMSMFSGKPFECCNLSLFGIFLLKGSRRLKFD